MTREALHELIDRIAEEEIVAARRFLENLARSPAFRAALPASPDDEPVTRICRRAKWLRATRFSANSELDEVHVA